MLGNARATGFQALEGESLTTKGEGLDGAREDPCGQWIPPSGFLSSGFL
jgi:hypothetical protein